MNSNLLLYLTALLQVTLVSMNVVFITSGSIIPMLIAGFGINLIWTMNVKRIAFSVWRERIIYAFGGMSGTLIGYYLSLYLLRFF